MLPPRGSRYVHRPNQPLSQLSLASIRASANDQRAEELEAVEQLIEVLHSRQLLLEHRREQPVHAITKWNGSVPTAESIEYVFVENALQAQTGQRQSQTVVQLRRSRLELPGEITEGVELTAMVASLSAAPFLLTSLPAS